jgi:hypothetical protein|tara:strand:- start:63 stop:716 length:654 start_codon:yes stop_codon:yes gene_type:complete
MRLKLHNTLTRNSKLPCNSFGIPASYCKTGSKLAKVKGSICEKCYGKKGNYLYPSYQELGIERKKFADDIEKFIERMVFLIECESNNYFRWFDNGDLQSYEQLKAILVIAKKLPSVTFWLTTKEYELIKRLIKDNIEIPKNLIIRVSHPMIDKQFNENSFFIKQGLNVSSAYKKEKFESIKNNQYSFSCPSTKQGNKCLTCRACWDSEIKNIIYKVK